MKSLRDAGGKPTAQETTAYDMGYLCALVDTNARVIVSQKRVEISLPWGWFVDSRGHLGVGNPDVIALHAQFWLGHFGVNSSFRYRLGLKGKGQQYRGYLLSITGKTNLERLYRLCFSISNNTYTVALLKDLLKSYKLSLSAEGTRT